MRFVSSQLMRALDAAAEVDHNIPTSVLMDAAGLGVATAIREAAVLRGAADLPVLLAAGRGNNGGDAFAAARHLLEWGFNATCLVAARKASDVHSAAARENLDRLPASAVRFLGAAADWDALRTLAFPQGATAVDALLGTGIVGEPHGLEVSAIRWLQRIRPRAFVVAVDVPSGMNADTGEFAAASVYADLTVTLALPKTGMAVPSPSIAEHCGRIEVADIGFPPSLTGPQEEDGLGFIGGSDVASLLPRRPRDAHKGTFGHVALIGGSSRYTGAIALAAAAAARSGAGLVSVFTPAEAALPLRIRLPEAIVRSMPCDTLSTAVFPSDLAKFLAPYNALVVGPGLTVSLDTADLLREVLRADPSAVVLDADALNLLALYPELTNELTTKSAVLTPHPGEAARLLGCDVEKVQQHRSEAVRSLSNKFRSTVVLKGEGTLVCAPGHGVHILRAGNPGLATGGSGDVLAGIVGGLLAQGLSPFDAARLGVWRHATLADHAAWRTSEPSLLPSDLLDPPGRCRS